MSTKEFEPFEGKPDKRRLISTYRGESVDRVPNFEVLIEDEHVKRILGREAGNTLGIGGEVAKGAKASEAVQRPMYPDDYIELCNIIGQDCICLECMWTPIRQIMEDGSIKSFNDRSLKSPKDLERIIWPGEEDVERILFYVREYVEAVRGTDIGVVLCGASIFQTLYEFVIGMHDCMIMTIEDPELLEELLQRSADYYERLFQGAIREGIDILFLGDDLAYNRGLFVPLDTLKRIWRPAYERLMAPALARRIPVKFHSDGKLDEAMDMFIEMGFSCINPLDPSGVDYREYKKRYGHRVTLSGGIDLTFPLINGSPDDVEEFVKELCRVMKPGGRWEAGSTHSIVNYIPHENFITMINAIHRYGRYQG